MAVALRTGWTPEQVWAMRPRDLGTVVAMLTEPGGDD